MNIFAIDFKVINQIEEYDMFRYKTKIKLSDTDAAGVIFFANQFRLLHDAFEELLEKAGFSVKYILEEADFVLPIGHAESDFILALKVGDRIEIQIELYDIGKNSFTLSYTVLNINGKVACKAKTIHFAIEKATNKKINLPSKLINRISSACS